MHDTRWIAATSAALRRLLEHGIATRDSVLAQVHVSALPPDQIELTVTRPTLNVILYDVRHDSNVRLLPGTPPESSRSAGAPLMLRVLLTAYGPVHDDAGDIAHRLLGAAMQVLEQHAVLDVEHLRSLPPLHADLPSSLNLRIVPVPMTLEDMSRLWEMLRASYRLSLVYELTLLPDGTSPREERPQDATAHPLVEPRLSAGPDSMMRDMSADARRGGNNMALFVADDAGDALRAAEQLAISLGRELMVMDIAAVANRYIGETEKNLARLFERAARAEAVLFFDEADALFGKRSNVKDSHDRYANMEVSALLEAMQNHPGVVVLHSNMRSNLDAAFMRRLRHVIDFD